MKNFALAAIVTSVLFILQPFMVLSQDYKVKDKTKYYVASDNFNAVTQHNLFLDKEGYRTVSKSLGISTEEAKKIIEACSGRYQPKNKRYNDFGYIMYKICEVRIPIENNYFYGETMFLMYFPNELNLHLPPDKLAANGKGFFQLELPDRVSTSPYIYETYKPQANSKNGNYAFGFVFKSNEKDSTVVEKVINTSHAKIAGLKAGDIIVSVNNTNIRHIDRKSALEIFKNCGFTNNAFKILRDDKEIQLTIDKVNTTVLETVCVSASCNNGDCVFENINGYTIHGTCVDGTLQGKVKFISETGFVFYEGEVYKYQNGADNNYKYRGFGTEKYKNGDKYEGQFANGKRDGEGTYTKANGEITKGFWKEGKYYDEIARGFDAEKTKTFRSTPKYLYDQKREFLTNANQVTFEENSIAEFKNNNSLSDVEFDKLMKLCDFKYKPINLSTPEKLKNLINDNQEEYRYTIYSMGYIKATNGNSYEILRMPGDFNSSLPKAMRIDEGNSLYFMAPYGEVNGMDYLTYKYLKGQQKPIESWNNSTEKNENGIAASYNASLNNKFKGVIIYQLSDWNYQNRKEEISYAVVSIHGPQDQEFLESDKENVDKLIGKKTLAVDYKKGMSSTQAKNYITSEIGSNRFSINTNYAYTIPKRNTADSNQENHSKELDKEIEDKRNKADKLMDELLENKSDEKIELRKRIAQELLTTSGTIINEPKKVQIIAISTSDKYYTENKKFIGKTGAVEGSLIENTDGTYHGTIKFDGETSSTIFYKVTVK